KIEVTFGNKRKNQDFSVHIYLLNQKNTNFANRAVNIKTNTHGEAYQWRLNNTVLGTGQNLSWIPEESGIYNLQLFVTKNKNKIDIENYSIIVNADADANGDDVVNVLDLSLLGLNWGRVMQDNDFDDSADVNGDGEIDILDAVRIGKKWT
ncbi:MAG: dockerin type I domain-containing protein, partial [Candidatus Methanoperedens sp.]|nr:dockerin type I domain-containing protein [Candidatus Methanoperedens sp.]